MIIINILNKEILSILHVLGNLNFETSTKNILVNLKISNLRKNINLF